ncbi:putative RNA-directed DNA polymerase [Helianthus annuus]|nr:putative RNA-directed DNA polymerase [Helianthus annuus]
MENFLVNRFWGRSIYTFETVDAIGTSGGLLSMWDPTVFEVTQVVKHNRFLLTSGTLKHTEEYVNVINVYAYNDPIDRPGLWAELLATRRSIGGLWVIVGDFNDVRIPEERFNSEFVALNAFYFNRFIQLAELCEYQMGGRKYTYHADNGVSMSKLDRLLVCHDFMNKWPQASLVALSNFVSDHSPILLSVSSVDFGPIPCRIFNSWMELPRFMEYVEQLCLEFRFEGPADLGLATKLKWVKYKIKGWVKELKVEKEAEYGAKVSQFEALELLAEDRSLSPQELELRADCKRYLMDADRLKTMDLKQKSRVKWAVDGDENTAYFHRVVNANTSNNRINGLMLDGEWVVTPTLLKDTICSFFAEKFLEPLDNRPSLICPNLASASMQENERLVAPFSVSEIKEAVWDCGSDKAPGPDGINFRFLKRCWGLLENDFVKLLEEFYNNATISQGCTSSFLALIPKCGDPGGLKDYRPISLVGCISKVISKVLANRLKPVIQNLIAEEHTGFLTNRSIMDGPLVLNELIAWMKKNRKSGFILKVDIEKAYDSVSWAFLESILSQLGFSGVWIKWVMATVTSARASVLVNGSPTHEFPCFRGLRQGDPLSPFLFLIVMEALTGVLKKAGEIGLFNGLRCGNNGPTLSHFLYADDAVFVGEWCTDNARNLNRILRCFYLASGLRVNAAKSSLYGIGVCSENTSSMADVFKCRVGSLPFKHLGLQVGANMNMVKHWDPVMEVFKNRLSAWKSNILSFGGKITLIKSVLNALPTYYFSIYKAPRQVIKQLERMRREFLWGINSDHSKMSWVAWQHAMTPREKGGLGLGSLREANLAMLAKWWWRFKVDTNGLWRKVIWSIHNSSRSWQFIPKKVTIAGSWKQVGNLSQDMGEYGMNLALLFRGILGQGDQITFWQDKWLFENPLQYEFPNLFELEQQKTAKVADRIFDSGGLLTIRFRWTRPPDSEAELTQLAELEHALMSVNVGEGKDKWSWDLDSSGNFSVSSLRVRLQTERFPDLNLAFEWNAWVPIKVNFFSWRLALNRVPTMVDLARRNVHFESLTCKLCGESNESVEHLFVACGFAKLVWDFIAQWSRCNHVFVFGIKDLFEIHRHVRGSPRWKKMLYSIIQIAVWCIWRCRNDRVFNRNVTTADGIKDEIRQLGFLWVRNRAKGQSMSWQQWCNFEVA